MKEKKPEVLPVDRETHRLMRYDALYYVPNKAYDEYDFLKVLSLKNQKGGDKDGKKSS
jgi:hypothetical protein